MIMIFNYIYYNSYYHLINYIDESYEEKKNQGQACNSILIENISCIYLIILFFLKILYLNNYYIYNIFILKLL